MWCSDQLKDIVRDKYVQWQWLWKWYWYIWLDFVLLEKMWTLLLFSSINITWFNEIFAPASFFTSIDMLSFRFILKSLQPVWSSMKISVLLPKIRWCWQYLGGKYWWFWGSMGDLLWTQISQFCKIWFRTLQSPSHHVSFPHLTSFSAQMKPKKII